MDIVHHALIGGVGFVVLSTNDQELAGMAFVAGSVVPDLDVAFMIFGKRFYLRNHQGPTHSIFLSPILALLISLPVLIPIGFNWPVYLAALLGLWLHVLLDLANTYGIALYWPVRRDRRSLDALFFIDAVTLSLTAAFYIQALWFPWAAVAYLYASLFVSYVIFKYFLHAKVMDDLKCAYAIPSSINPFSFFILSLHETAASAFIYNAWSRKEGDKQTYEAPEQKYVEMAEKSEVFRDMRRITKYFFITDVTSNEAGTSITGQDIGVRNFGGRFGRTVLKFDQNDELIDEMASI